MRDFYQQIIDGLNRDLDPREFEQCACSILRDEYPTLVPILGGSDAGMDGAIADGEGEAFPLIVTTGEDPLGNLRANVDAHLKKLFPRHKAVFATSRPLTPQMRRKLEEEAREKGFTLVQIVDQAGIADRLYHNSAWCRSLLGLTGTPSVLSVVPLTRRPLLTLEPIGRNADLEWLKSTKGDRVLVGEPGSGKTFLLYHMARQGRGLFLTSNDPTAIANALRDHQPEVVIVDDAQVDPAVLTRLRHLRDRDEDGAKFSIVAITWKGALDQVTESLGGVPRSQVRQLELLTREELVQVIEQVGVHDREWIRLIVNQSANKPGLAVTQAQLALQGELKDIVEGTVLRRTLVTAFRTLTGRDPTWTLAVFGLGGDAGMPIDTVGAFLHLDRRQMLEEVSGLAAGGALTEVRDRSLAVRPQILRWNLVARVFFSGEATDQPYQDVIAQVPSLADAVKTILMSVGRAHAVIPEVELRELVRRVEAPDVWRIYASLGATQANWVLEHYFGDLMQIAPEALQQAPEAVIPKLLERAQGDGRSLLSHPNHPLRMLSDWVRDLNVPPGESIARRQRLAMAARALLEGGGDREVGIHAICVALSPALEGQSSDPGMGRTITYFYGLLQKADLLAMSAIWNEVQEAVTGADMVHWQHFSTALWDWIYPDHVLKTGSPPTDVVRIMHEFARTLLVDLAGRAQQSTGARSKIQALSRRLGEPLKLDLDPEFESLFPDDSLDEGDWQENERKRRERVEALAAEWSRRKPEDVAIRLALLEREAAAVGQSWPRLTPVLAAAIADQVTETDRWLHSFLSEGLLGDLVDPFLKAALRAQTGQWRSAIATCLERDSYAGYATALLLTMEAPPPDLLDRSLEVVERFAPLVEGLSSKSRVPLATLTALLRHASWEVALHAAVGEWEAEPRGKVRTEVLREWQEAVLRARADIEGVGAGYGLGLILASDPELALLWLRERFEQGDLPTHFSARSPLEIAVSALNPVQRLALLRDLPPQPILRWLLPRLVGEDLELFKSLLSTPNLSEFHLFPLFGLPDECWSKKAVAALAAGKDAERIAETTVWGGIQVISRSGVEDWKRWADAFSRFESADNQELRAVARHGRAMAEYELERAVREERHLRLSGFAA